MTVTTKIEFKEYLKLMYILTYRKWRTIFITIIGIGMFVFLLLYYLGIINAGTKTYNPIFQFVFAILVVLGLPFSVYRMAKKNFSSHTRLQENIEYDLSVDKMKTKGESFNSELDWSKTYKIEEISNWFLIYQSKQVANLISKKNITETQINEMRAIFKAQKGVILKLK